MMRFQSIRPSVSAYALVGKRHCGTVLYHDCAMESLRARMIHARKAANLSQAALAKLAKCGQTTIASIENGRNQSSSILARVASILQVEPLWLAEGKGPKSRDYSSAIPAVTHRVSEPTPDQRELERIVSDEEQRLLDGYRIADEGLKRSLRMLADDALERFGRRRANHQ